MSNYQYVEAVYIDLTLITRCLLEKEIVYILSILFQHKDV